MSHISRYVFIQAETKGLKLRIYDSDIPIDAQIKNLSSLLVSAEYRVLNQQWESTIESGCLWGAYLLIFS